MLKRIKMVAGIVRVKDATREQKHEMELLSKNLGFIATWRMHNFGQFQDPYANFFQIAYSASLQTILD